MPIADLTLCRLHTQGLLCTRSASSEEMVGWNVAVQSQDYAGAKWTLGQRLDGATDTDLDRQFDDGAFLRTHVLRPTWHFVLPRDLRWLLELTAPRVHAANKGRYRDLELDETTLERGTEVIVRAIADAGLLTRQELGEALAAGGIDPGGQRLGYLTMYAELERAICSGPRRGKQHTYARFDDRVPPGPAHDRDEAIAELAYRYIASHGPVTPPDFAWWSGLILTDARRGFAAVEDRIERLAVDDETWWIVPDGLPEPPEGPLVHLLQPWDEYVVGFRQHQPVWDPDIRAAQNPKGELWNASLIAVDGIVSGGWRRKLSAKEVRVEPLLPAPLSPGHRAALERAAAGYGRFLAREPVLALD